MLNQTFEPRDLLLIVMLVVLEGLLSIDNALVLGLLARRLPPRSQTKALTYGLIGSFFFRLIAIAMAAWLLRWRITEEVGGVYLLYVAAKHFLRTGKPKRPILAEPARIEFWTVVASIELTDIAFAADSILASIALVGPMPPHSPSPIHPKLWLILLGGMMGVVLMRVAAVAFIRLLKSFPRFETSAYLLVATVGLKLLADGWYNWSEDRVDFQSPTSPAFWVFWSVMLLWIGVGFLPRRQAGG